MMKIWMEESGEDGANATRSPERALGVPSEPGARRRERMDLSCMASPEEVLRAVEDEAARSGQVLTGIQVDGVEVDEAAFRAMTVGHDAVFTLKPLRALLRESLDSAAEYSDRLRAGVELIAERAEAGDASTALSGLAYMLDGLDWLFGMYDRCRGFLPAPLRPAEEDVLRRELLGTLRGLMDWAKEGNWDGVAWALRMEAAPHIETLAFRLRALAALRLDPQ